MFKKLLKNNIFLILIICVLVFSLLWPKPGQVFKDLDLLTPLTFVAMFVSGLGLPFKKIKNGFREYKSILFSFVSVFIFFPVVTWLLFNLLGQTEGDIYMGGMILAVQSSTLSSAIVLTISAGGNVPLALIITIVNNMASAFFTPVLLKIFLSTHQQIAFNLGEMMMKLVVTLVLPVVLAQLLRLVIAKHLDKTNFLRKIIGQLVVLCFILTGAASASSQLLSNPGVAVFVLFIVVVLHLAMLSISILYSKLASLGKESRIAVMLCSSQKTLPASLMIWGEFFPQYTLAPIVIVSYHVMQLFIDSIISSVISNPGDTKKTSFRFRHSK